MSYMGVRDFTLSYNGELRTRYYNKSGEIFAPKNTFTKQPFQEKERDSEMKYRESKSVPRKDNP